MKEKKLELYYFEQCPYCQYVLSALKTSGIADKVILLDIRADQKLKEKLIKVTGRGTTPCLFIDDKPMFESRDIADWIQRYARELQGEKGRN